MKKTLLALALLGAFGAASAQSSVTLYGIADVNLQRSDPKANTAGTNPEATTGVSSGYQAGSRLGVRGTEALGGGLNAVFTLEMGYNIDVGTRGQGTTAANIVGPAGGTLAIPAVDRLFGRQAWAGLSGGFGSIVAGRIPTFSSGTGSFDMFGQIDPFDTGWGALGLQASFSSANSLRLDNTIAYVTPAALGGFKAGVAYSFNAIGGENAGGGTNNVRVIGTGASFAAGPFYGAVTYDSVDYPSTISSDKQSHLQVGGTFDLKFVKLAAAWAQEKSLVALDVGKAAIGGDADAWMVGATVPFGATQLRASYQQRNADAIGAVADGKKKTFGIGLRHALSNRTFLALGYGDQKNEGSLKTASGGVKEMTLGVRHNF